MPDRKAGAGNPELFQFSFSHYNEKARWALDYKKVVHVRRSLLPGPHMPVMLRLSGQSQTPALRAGGETITGSARIIDWLEQNHPEPALYPSSPEDRARALEIQRWFDEKLGSGIRRAFFFETLSDGRPLADMMSQDFNPVVRLAYRTAFPATRMLMKREMRITKGGAARGRSVTREALDFVAERTGRDGYLVGNHFSVADLAAASLLAVTCFPKGYGAQPAKPYPPGLSRWLSRWESHPTLDWVREIFRKHRGKSAEIKK